MYAHLSQEEFVDSLYDFDSNFKLLTVNTLSRWGRGQEVIQQAFDKSAISKALGKNNKEILNFHNNILNPKSFTI